MQKHVNLVHLAKSFPTNIFLQNLASIQKRTSRITFAHLADKSEKSSISNLSTKVFSSADFLDLKYADRVLECRDKKVFPVDLEDVRAQLNREDNIRL